MIEIGILFGDIHSFRGLNLILSRIEIPPAKPKTTYVEIPGGDGSVDLSEANGEVKFYDRDCKFTFTMNPAGDLSEAAWEAKKTQVSNALSGKEFKITLDKNKAFYYKGRCSVDEYLSNKRLRQIVVAAKVRPYKYKQNVTVVGVDLTPESTGDIPEPITREITLKNARKTVCPVITCTEAVTIIFGGNTYTLNSGTHKLLNIELKMGDNQLTVTSTGYVEFAYQEGDL